MDLWCQVIEIFGMTDDFCKEFVLKEEKYIIEDQRKDSSKILTNYMSNSWIIMVDLILFHSSGFITSSIITRSMSANIDKLCVGKEYMGNPLFENLF